MARLLAGGEQPNTTSPGRASRWALHRGAVRDRPAGAHQGHHAHSAHTEVPYDR